MATYCSIPAWKNPATEEPGRASPWHRVALDMTELTGHTHT